MFLIKLKYNSVISKQIGRKKMNELLVYSTGVSGKQEDPSFEGRSLEYATSYGWNRMLINDCIYCIGILSYV